MWSAHPAVPLTPAFASHPRLALAAGSSPACLVAPRVSGAQGTGANAGSAHIGQNAAVLGATDGRLGLGGLGGPVGRLAAALFNKITDAGVACVITQHQDIVGEDGPSAVRGWWGHVHRHFFWHVPLRWALARLSEFRGQGGKQDRATPPSGPERDRRVGAAVGPPGSADHPGDRGWASGPTACPARPAGQWTSPGLTLLQEQVFSSHLPGVYYLTKSLCTVVPRGCTKTNPVS